MCLCATFPVSGDISGSNNDIIAVTVAMMTSRLPHALVAALTQTEGLAGIALRELRETLMDKRSIGQTLQKTDVPM